MIKVKFILISGKANSGKGTVAQLLEKLLIKEGNHVIRCSLSTYIRKIAKEDFYWDGIDTDKSRKFMQEVYRIGTEFYPYHMARRVWEKDIFPFAKKNTIAIIESFREKVNYDYFSTLWWAGEITTIRVNRPNFNVFQNKERENHISEIDLDNFKFDYEITNDGSIIDLENKLKNIFNL